MGGCNAHADPSTAYGLKIAIPPAAASLVANVTVTNPSASGYLSAYPGDGIVASTSNLNDSAGETGPNIVIGPTYYGIEDGFMNLDTGPRLAGMLCCLAVVV